MVCVFVTKYTDNIQQKIAPVVIKKKRMKELLFYLDTHCHHPVM